jgi:hypothetical protein
LRFLLALAGVLSLLVFACPANADSGQANLQSVLAHMPAPIPFALAKTAKQLGLTSDDAYPSTCVGEKESSRSANVNLIVDDAVNVGVGRNQGCLTPQNEPTVAVNPTDARNLIAGANDYRDCCVDSDDGKRNDGGGYAYVSRNGGKTWVNVKLPGLTQLDPISQPPFNQMDSAGDPVVVFAPDGTVYYVNLVFSRSLPLSAIAVSASYDKGESWGPPALVALSESELIFLDKPWAGVSPRGKLVVTWTEFRFDVFNNYLGSPIVMSEKVDEEFSEPKLVSERHLYSQGSQVGFDQDGTLYVAYESTSSDPANHLETSALVLASRADNASTFTEREVSRIYDDLNCYPIDWDSYRQTISGFGFRINSYPSMVVFADGKVYLTYADNEGSGTCGDPLQTQYPTINLFQGETKNVIHLVTVGTDSQTSHNVAIDNGVMPAVALDGNRPVVFYQRPSGSGSLEAVLRYGEKTTVVSDGPSYPQTQFGGQFIGDYQALAVVNGVAHPVWTDSRGSSSPNQDIYTAAVPLSAEDGGFPIPWEAFVIAAFGIGLIGIGLYPRVEQVMSERSI